MDHDFFEGEFDPALRPYLEIVVGDRTSSSMFNVMIFEFNQYYYSLYTDIFQETHE